MKKTKQPLSRSQIMSRVKSKNTSIEVMLRKELWKRGLRYRKNVKSIKGTPDIAFIGLKIAIFCDSEFWHGKYFLEKGALPKNNMEYWKKKFEKNIKRDIETNAKLKEMGWTVLRFWEKDIRKNVSGVADEIEKTYIKAKQNLNTSLT